MSLITVLWLHGNSQQPQPVIHIDTSLNNRKLWEKRLQDVFDMGIEKKGDSLVIREEVIKLVNDSVYRNSIYPPKYEWAGALAFLKAMDLKKAFWHMMNIYMTDSSSRQFVLSTFVLYDSLMEMDKILLNTFYTYAMTDPRVCRISNKKPAIIRPDLLEKNLMLTKEIIYSILYYRKERVARAKN